METLQKMSGPAAGSKEHTDNYKRKLDFLTIKSWENSYVPMPLSDVPLAIQGPSLLATWLFQVTML